MKTQKELTQIAENYFRKIRTRMTYVRLYAIEPHDDYVSFCAMFKTKAKRHEFKIVRLTWEGEIIRKNDLL